MPNSKRLTAEALLLPEKEVSSSSNAPGKGHQTGKLRRENGSVFTRLQQIRPQGLNAGCESVIFHMHVVGKVYHTSILVTCLRKYAGSCFQSYPERVSFSQDT